MSTRWMWLIMVASLVAMTSTASAATDPTLAWSDEFDGPAGTPPDPSKWRTEVGGHGWGNSELQYYSAHTRTAALDGEGNLVITALPARAGLSCWYGPCRYESARLTTLGLFGQRYGRFEARLRLPQGRGLWSAFWLTGSNIAEVGWPASGEIDIVEHLGHQPHTVHSALHASGYDSVSDHDLPGVGALFDGFHVFAVDWRPDRMEFSVDGKVQRVTPRVEWAAAGDVFDRPFFVLVNLAVGGNWPGAPDDSTRLPQRLLVDYVRVYHARRFSFHRHVRAVEGALQSAAGLGRGRPRPPSPAAGQHGVSRHPAPATPARCQPGHGGPA